MKVCNAYPIVPFFADASYVNTIAKLCTCETNRVLNLFVLFLLSLYVFLSLSLSFLLLSGALTINYPAEALGPHFALLLTNIPFILGAGISASYGSFWVILVGRIIVGYAIGTCSTTLVRIATSPSLLSQVSYCTPYRCLLSFSFRADFFGIVSGGVGSF